MALNRKVIQKRVSLGTLQYHTGVNGNTQALCQTVLAFGIARRIASSTDKYPVVFTLQRIANIGHHAALAPERLRYCSQLGRLEQAHYTNTNGVFGGERWIDAAVPQS